MPKITHNSASRGVGLRMENYARLGEHYFDDNDVSNLVTNRFRMGDYSAALFLRRFQYVERKQYMYPATSAVFFGEILVLSAM